MQNIDNFCYDLSLSNIFGIYDNDDWASQVSEMVKNLPAMQET